MRGPIGDPSNFGTPKEAISDRDTGDVLIAFLGSPDAINKRVGMHIAQRASRRKAKRLTDKLNKAWQKNWMSALELADKYYGGEYNPENASMDEETAVDKLKALKPKDRWYEMDPGTWILGVRHPVIKHNRKYFAQISYWPSKRIYTVRLNSKKLGEKYKRTFSKLEDAKKWGWEKAMGYSQPESKYRDSRGTEKANKNELDSNTRRMVKGWIKGFGGDKEKTAKWMRDTLRLGGIKEMRRLIKLAEESSVDETAADDTEVDIERAFLERDFLLEDTDEMVAIGVSKRMDVFKKKYDISTEEEATRAVKSFVSKMGGARNIHTAFVAPGDDLTDITVLSEKRARIRKALQNRPPSSGGKKRGKQSPSGKRYYRRPKDDGWDDEEASVDEWEQADADEEMADLMSNITFDIAYRMVRDGSAEKTLKWLMSATKKQRKQFADQLIKDLKTATASTEDEWEEADAEDTAAITQRKIDDARNAKKLFETLMGYGSQLKSKTIDDDKAESIRGAVLRAIKKYGPGVSEHIAGWPKYKNQLRKAWDDPDTLFQMLKARSKEKSSADEWEEADTEEAAKDGWRKMTAHVYYLIKGGKIVGRIEKMSSGYTGYSVPPTPASSTKVPGGKKVADGKPLNDIKAKVEKALK